MCFISSWKTSSTICESRRLKQVCFLCWFSWVLPFMLLVWFNNVMFLQTLSSHLPSPVQHACVQRPVSSTLQSVPDGWTWKGWSKEATQRAKVKSESVVSFCNAVIFEFFCVVNENVFCHRSGGERGARGKKERRRGHEGREKRKGGYCECCEVKFDNLKAVRIGNNRKPVKFKWTLCICYFSSKTKKDTIIIHFGLNQDLHKMHDICAHFFWPSDHQHLESKQHQAFSKSDEYGVVDRVTAGLTCDLINIGTHCRRYKRVIKNYTFPYCLLFFFFLFFLLALWQHCVNISLP